MSLRIAGAGCSLLDVLYGDVDFSSKNFREYLSQKDGDGGLFPGKLVFTEEFEQFCGKSFAQALEDITKKIPPSAKNLGGPAIVALIHAAQLLQGKEITVEFYGARGNDDFGGKIMSIINCTPVLTDGYGIKPGVTSSTAVFSDPRCHDGQGERIFINNIGAAWNYYPSDLPESFFSADITMFGATGLVPRLHDNLTSLVQKAKSAGAVTLVTTVYDFRNEKRNPGGKWPLGESDDTFRYTDLFIADYEEALKISGKKDIQSAMEFYIDRGAGAVIVTHGPEDIHLFSSGRMFAPLHPATMPVSRKVGAELRETARPKGDTTGCGDNFVGGVLASLASQLKTSGLGKLNLPLACAWGVVSGGFTTFYVGGTYVEKSPGEKYQKIIPYLKDYAAQTGLNVPSDL